MSWWDLVPFLIAAAFAAPIIAVGNLTRPVRPARLSPQGEFALKLVLVLGLLTILAILLPLWVTLGVAGAVVAGIITGVAALIRKARRSWR